MLSSSQSPQFRDMGLKVSDRGTQLWLSAGGSKPASASWGANGLAASPSPCVLPVQHGWVPPGTATCDSLVASWAPFLPDSAGHSENGLVGEGQTENRALSPLSPTQGAVEVLLVTPAVPRAGGSARLQPFFSWKNRN